MKIKLNQIFSTDVNPKLVNWEKLTKGNYIQGLNLYIGKHLQKEFILVVLICIRVCPISLKSMVEFH